MRARLLDIVAEIRSSYWFVPSLMAVGAFLLFNLMTYLDERIPYELLSSIPFVYINQPDGAKTLLGTVAGSMITVAGVTFSIVMVVLTMASSQFGPRLLRNFMRDRGNQLVLGTFVATFLYCLLVLRTVRAEGDAFDTPLFVPHLSITVAVLLTLINLGMFIYFIHHTAESIQVSNVIAKVNHALGKKIMYLYPDRTLFPEHVGTGREEERLPEDFEAGKAVLHSKKGGYLRGIDKDGLLEMTEEHGLVVKLLRHPGAYVMGDEPLAEVYPGVKLAEVEDDLRNRFALGSHRTQTQDLGFMFDQLLEVALRALSPGVNDPFTAIMCIDRIADNLLLLATCDLPSPYRYDEEGTLRVVAPVLEPEPLLEHLFGPLRNYGKGDYMTLHHILGVLGRMGHLTNNAHFRGQVLRELERLKATAKDGLLDVDYARFAEAYEEIQACVRA